MKRVFTLSILSFLLLGPGLNAQPNVSAVRIGETNPSENVYIFGTGEQLSGQQFQTDGLITYNGYQYAVYYNLLRNVCIARRKMPVGSWEEVVLPYKNTVDDAHNVISMGICANDGTIHLAYDHHNDPLHYCYSTMGLANDPSLPWAASSFSATTDIMDEAVPDVTYPRFISKPDGNLLFECRFHYSGYGDSYLREYDASTKKWTLIGRYVQGMDVTPDACAYINGITYDYLNRLHITWCWRDDFGGQSNHDFYYAYSEDHGRTWKDNNGDHVATTQYMKPVVNTITGTCLTQKLSDKLMIEEIGFNRGYINQETQAVDSKGHIHSVNSHIPDDGGTDANWASSRLKARLHHRFRKADGTWVTRFIKNNGTHVHSYCRVNLSFDAFDNAYVIANGAEVYVATEANDYNDWELLSDVDAGRFLSEPLVDRPLLKNNGILSFVYLGADKKITVIDYLAKNPNTPNGTGLLAEYFSDENFETLISSEIVSSPQESSIPANTKSIRWSGSFETLLGEKYTLYINTPSKTSVYVNGKRVALTTTNAQAKEYDFQYPLIPSHKNNIVIESASNHALSLMWSSETTVKEAVPATSLYPVKKNDEPAELTAPDLQMKETLINTLTTASSTINSSEKSTFTLSFDPASDYSLEIKTKINLAQGRGLDLETRAKNGKGFRVSLDETNIKNTNPLSNTTQLFINDNTQEQTYRFAVNGEKVHIYVEQVYLGTAGIDFVKDILTDDTESESAGTYGNDIIGEWYGTGLPTTFGWSASASAPWSTGGGGVRFETPTHNVEGEGTYPGTLLTIRWDASDLNGATYFYPVTLEANTSYEFSFLHEYWGSASSAQTLTVGISTSQSDANIYNSQSFVTSGTAQTLKPGKFIFTSQEAGVYYLTFKGTWAMHAIGKLELKSYTYENRLLLGKNYNGGFLNADILYVSYEEGAFAPYLDVPVTEPELPAKRVLPIQVQGNTIFNNNTGAKDIRILDFNPTDDYSVEIAATINSADGRGLDLEARDENQQGFRTSLNTDYFRWISPFNKNLFIENVNNNKQVIRYAVQTNNVHVYLNEEFVNTFSLTGVGNMNATGNAEEAIGSEKPANMNDKVNIIENPDFANDVHNAAPTGWLSDATLGNGSPNARIQEKSQTTELAAYPDGKKAFLIRFDASGGTYFSYPVTLEANKWYEYSFDVITWGDNNNSKEFNVLVSTDASGDNAIAEKVISTPSTRQAVERNVFRFKISEAGIYYLVFKKINTVGTIGITDLYLYENAVNRLLFGKNYTDGSVNISVDYIAVDYSGAFAPEKEVNSIVETDKNNNLILYSKNNALTVVSKDMMYNVSVFNTLGRCCHNQKINDTNFSVNLPKGIYIVHINTGKDNVVKKTLIN